MSNRYRNPFKIRATEKLESENNFLRMYSPFVLEEFIIKNKSGKLWNDVLFIRSSPGGGKTSILKLLEPNCLLTLSNNRSATYSRDIIEYLKTLEVMDDSCHINVAGVYLNCARNYEVIEDLDISEGQKKNLFFAVINARVILSTLRTIISLNGGIDLSTISIKASNFDYSFLDIDFPIAGKDLFDWAANIERSVFKAIDSFLPIQNVINGHSELFAFDLMQAPNIIVGDKELESRVLFMFDDAHKLSRFQRKHFVEHLIVKRSGHSIWIAERLEALDEQRNFGSYRDRDYNEINLEEIWQGTNKLKTIVGNIAEKRATMSSEGVDSFEDFLEASVNENEYENRFIASSVQSLNNIKAVSDYTQKFDNWLNYLLAQSGTMTALQLALLSRQIEILVHRNIGKSQMSFEFPLTEEELKQKIGGEVQSVALYFISMESKIPYYYGFDNLAKLSSNNIEQFLSFAGELFEIMVARKISDKTMNIDAAEQEKVLKKVAERKWLEQSRLVSEGVIKFLQNLAEFSKKETNKPNAPYAPGVNGFSIREPIESKLVNNGPWDKDPIYRPLMDVIRTCLAYNLLEKRITKQGKENQQWEIFYLNRWICLRFNLPFSYGGFRHKTPNELLKWIK